MLTATLKDLELPFDVTEIDIDEDMDTAMKYGVRGVPTLILLDDEGKQLVTNVGSLTKQQFIDKFLNL
jgi:thioredoxin 1